MGTSSRYRVSAAVFCPSFTERAQEGCALNQLPREEDRNVLTPSVFDFLVDLCNGEFEGGSGLQFVNVGGQNGKSEF